MAGNRRINIFRDPTNKFDLVEIKLIGDPNSVIYKMKEKEAEIKDEFPNEYNAYYKNKATVKKETPLSKLKSINRNKKKFFEMEGITSIEQLSQLSDGACHGLGKDVLDHRKEAKRFLNGGKEEIQQIVGKE
jgi:hypothetical protein|tara:strand:- start:570 stop:965 length:396 start_codon:yes stop_codon:yes gene_type:complete